MMYAMKDGQRVPARTKGQSCTCPVCGAEVVAKVGAIKQPHFAHISLLDCDTWSEGETQWHLTMKNMFPLECQEVVVGKHRADVKTPSGMVIEFQHSAIDLFEMTIRENHYGDMIWVFDARKKIDDVDFYKHGLNGTKVFKVKYPIQRFGFRQRPVFLDLTGDGFFEVKWSSEDSKYLALKYISTVDFLIRFEGAKDVLENIV